MVVGVDSANLIITIKTLETNNGTFFLVIKKQYCSMYFIAT
jgi:hypothetical protein